MLKSIKIENFKGVENLNIDEFTNINILVGENGCGKTSILEAILINANPISHCGDIITQANLREILITPNNANIFFNRLKMDSEIKIESTYDNNEPIEITIKKIENNNVQTIKTGFNIQEQKNKIDLEFKRNQEIIHYKIDNNANIDRQIKNNIINNIFLAEFIPSDHSKLNINNIINHIRIENREQEIYDFLEKYNKDFQSVEVIENKIMVQHSNFDEKIDINILGAGFKKILNIGAIAIKNDAKIICIDEIENGLYYDNIEKLVNFIITISKENEIQFFITTHSKEFLEILAKVADKINANHLIKTYSIVNRNGYIKGFANDIDMIPHYYESENDIR